MPSGSNSTAVWPAVSEWLKTARCVMRALATRTPYGRIACAAWSCNPPRGGTALRTTSAGRFAICTRSTELEIPRRSRIPARQGMRIRSAALAAARAAVSECGAVSMMQMSAPCFRAVSSTSSSRLACAEMTIGVSFCRWSCQPFALACGSRSMTTLRWPKDSAAPARLRASVVLPAPPFCEIIASVFMLTPLQYDKLS